MIAEWTKCLSTNHDCRRSGVIDLIIVLITRRVSDDDLIDLIENRTKAIGSSFVDGQLEMRAHRRSNNFGIIWIDRFLGHDHIIGSSGRGGTKQRAEIAWITYAIGNHCERRDALPDVQIIQIGHRSNGQNSLRELDIAGRPKCFGIGCADRVLAESGVDTPLTDIVADEHRLQGYTGIQ